MTLIRRPTHSVRRRVGSWPYTMTEVNADNFDRANSSLDATSNWTAISSLAKAQIVGNQVVGSGDANCRTRFVPAASASRAGQYYKADIVGIANRVGLIYNSNTGSSSSWAVLSNATTLLLGATASSTSSNSGTVHNTITVPTVTPPKEMLAMFTSDSTEIGRAHV